MRKVNLLVLSALLIVAFVGCSELNTGISGDRKLVNAGKSALKEAGKDVDFILIKGLEVFKASLAKGVDAEETILHMFNALYMYEIDEKIADEMLRQVLDKSSFTSSGTFGSSVSEGLRYIKSSKNIIRSYFGAVPPDYSIEITDKFTVTFKPNKTQDMGRKTLKYFVDSKGKDFDTPIHVKEEAGIWKISNFSSVYTGVRKEAAE